MTSTVRNPSSPNGATGAQPPAPGGIGQVGVVGGSSVGARRRFSWVFLGLLLIGASVLVFVLWTINQGARTPVLVAGQPIEAGSVIEVDDVKLVPVAADAGIDLLDRTDRELIVGQVARVDIPVNTPLTPQLVATSALIPAGMSVVGAALKAGEYPVSQLSIGDEVVLLQVQPQGTSVDSGSQELGTAVIWALAGLQEQAEPRFFISLLVPEDRRLEVATAISQQRLRVALVGTGS